MGAGRGTRAARLAAPVSRHRRAAVLRRMDEEWEALQDDEAAAASCRSWSRRCPPLAGCERPEDVLQRVAGAPDQVLLLLLQEAAAGHALAARVVLQALLPKVVRMASVDPAAEVDDYLTALWCEVVSYPVRRRPTSVAANLALDTLKAVRRERRPAPDVAMAPHLVLLAADRHPDQLLGSPPAPDTTTADLVLRRAREHRLVDPGTGDLLLSVYAEGLSGESAARRHGLSPGAVRARCSRALRVLARHPELLASVR